MTKHTPTSVTERLDRLAEREGVVAAFDTAKHLADELLEALKEVRARFGSCGIPMGWESTFNSVNAAIAKAEKKGE